MGAFRHRNKKKNLTEEQRKAKIEKWDKQEKKVKTEEYNTTAFDYRNILFETFYKVLKNQQQKKRILKEEFNNEKEFNDFLKILKERLPVTFRINRTVPNYQNFQKLLDEYIGKNEEEMQKIKWFPMGLTYQMLQNRQELKKEHSVLREMIINANDSGLISRQELVSMLPPLFLDIQKSDLILDLCAAPGSKTGQMLEMIGDNIGGVVANDVDFQRASMLIHQIQRINNSSGIMVVNHIGQQIPSIHNYYDKVLCDVPCSGDGAIRKLPNKWRFWSYKDGCGLHGLQCQILIRGLQLLKVGGLLVYSTCSLNPIEDEAVITEVFRRLAHHSQVELIDIHQYAKSHFLGLKTRKGMQKWQVYKQKSTYTKQQQIHDQNNNVYESDQIYHTFDHYQQYITFKQENPQESELDVIKDSMFSQDNDFMNLIGIQKTIRIMPHDQNTGGFYIALFRKKQDIVLNNLRKSKEEEIPNLDSYIQIQNNINDNNNYKDSIKNNNTINNNIIIDYQNQKINQKINRKAKDKQDIFIMDGQWDKIDDKIWDWIKNYYGFQDNYIQSRLFMEKEGQKRIVFVSDKIRDIFNTQFRKNLNIVNTGSKAFNRNKKDLCNGECPYRICQDSVLQLSPYFKNRKINITLKAFKDILKSNQNSLNYDELNNMQPDLGEKLQKLNNGNVVLIVDDIKDMIVVCNFTRTVCLMIPKETYQSYRIRYLCDQVDDYQKVDLQLYHKPINNQ